jgi:hypothetical protein
VSGGPERPRPAAGESRAPSHLVRLDRETHQGGHLHEPGLHALDDLAQQPAQIEVGRDAPANRPT